MCPQKSGIPDRWADYCNFKSFIKECKIISCKTPLKNELFRSGVENMILREDQNFTPSNLCRMVREALKLKIEFVIDFTNTRRYYNYQDFEDGVRYIKIPCIGQCIPLQQVYNQFHMAMEKCTEALSADGVIAVHCTHGINRSGFLVCNYLMNKFGYTMEQAVYTFNTARGHEIERAEYLDKLYYDKYPPPTGNTFELEDHPVAETIVTDSIVNEPVETKSPPHVKRNRNPHRKKKPSTPKEQDLHKSPHKQHHRPPRQRHSHHNSHEYDYYPPHPPLDRYPRHQDRYREPAYHDYYGRPREFEPFYSRRGQASYYPPTFYPPRDSYHHPPPGYLPPYAWGPPAHIPPYAWGPPAHIPKGAYRIHDSPSDQPSHKHHSEVRTYSGVPYIKH